MYLCKPEFDPLLSLQIRNKELQEAQSLVMNHVIIYTKFIGPIYLLLLHKYIKAFTCMNCLATHAFCVFLVILSGAQIFCWMNGVESEPEQKGRII